MLGGRPERIQFLLRPRAVSADSKVASLDALDDSTLGILAEPILFQLVSHRTFAVFLLYLKLHHILAKEGLQFSRSHAPTGPFEISGGQAMECLYNVRFAKVELLTRNTPPYARFRYRCQRCT